MEERRKVVKKELGKYAQRAVDNMDFLVVVLALTTAAVATLNVHLAVILGVITFVLFVVGSLFKTKE